MAWPLSSSDIVHALYLTRMHKYWVSGVETRKGQIGHVVRHQKYASLHAWYDVLKISLDTLQ